MPQANALSLDYDVYSHIVKYISSFIDVRPQTRTLDSDASAFDDISA